MIRNFTFLVAVSCFTISCSGDQATTDTNSTNDPKNTTRNVTQNTVVSDFATADLSQFILKDQPIYINKEEQLVAEIPEGAEDYFPLNKANDLEKFLSVMRKEEKAKLDCWGMHDKLYDVFYDADPDKPILDRHILARKLLNEKELKYYKLWFMLTLKDNTDNPENAFLKIKTKLNELCVDCIPLSEEQITKIESQLKETNSFGVFELMRAQQINNYGID